MGGEPQETPSSRWTEASICGIMPLVNSEKARARGDSVLERGEFFSLFLFLVRRHTNEMCVIVGEHDQVWGDLREQAAAKAED